jgi:hypothetical protein
VQHAARPSADTRDAARCPVRPLKAGERWTVAGIDSPPQIQPWKRWHHTLVGFGRS